VSVGLTRRSIEHRRPGGKGRATVDPVDTRGEIRQVESSSTTSYASAATVVMSSPAARRAVGAHPIGMVLAQVPEQEHAVRGLRPREPGGEVMAAVAAAVAFLE
jgi:hypothetical protein